MSSIHSTMTEPTEKIDIHRGLKGVYFDRSAVCFIDGRAGAGSGGALRSMG